MRIWRPIEPHLKVNNEVLTKIIVIPDGQLWHVLFPLLVDENGTRLLHKHAISLAFSISSLKSNIKYTELTRERNTVLVIGNPFVSPEDENVSCVNLPMATQESIDVKNMFEAKLHEVKIVHLTGTASTKQAVISSLPKARFFHIAAHATDFTTNANQLPGCLLLARDASADESGILHADEIQSLDLRGLRLAFLNCCHTGSGQVYSEGLIGLARAFLFAGAHEVVVSMRPVSDSQSTCDFVNKFYEEYFGNAKGEADVALNEAQKHMDQKGVDVIEWGSYYVIRQMICN